MSDNCIGGMAVRKRIADISSIIDWKVVAHEWSWFCWLSDSSCLPSVQGCASFLWFSRVGLVIAVSCKYYFPFTMVTSKTQFSTLRRHLGGDLCKVLDQRSWQIRLHRSSSSYSCSIVSLIPAGVTLSIGSKWNSLGYDMILKEPPQPVMHFAHKRACTQVIQAHGHMVPALRVHPRHMPTLEIHHCSNQASGKWHNVHCQHLPDVLWPTSACRSCENWNRWCGMLRIEWQKGRMENPRN